MGPRPDISAPVGSRFVHGDTLAYDSDRLAGGRTGPSRIRGGASCEIHTIAG